jgi:GNAT superfamily N-acetyltransferase
LASEDVISQLSVRLARESDVPTLRRLIDASVRGLQAGDYSPGQIDAALRQVFGVDSRLIADGTYLVAQTTSGEIAGCGGWSNRRTLYGGDVWMAREDSLLDPAKDAARIRAFFVHPRWARRGVGTLMLAACENAALAAGFTRFEMGSTLTGVPLYSARGYRALENLVVPLGGGLTLPIVRMEKQIPHLT